MNGLYYNAWQFVKEVINREYPFPQHQGTTDITEVINFHDIAESHKLSQRQYDALINKAQKYHDKKDKEVKSR